MERGDRFDHPLIERYASRDMARLFSPRARHGAWRDLWICLAEAEQKLGFPVTEAQIAELKEHRDTFDWDRVAALEKELRHDVMAHVHHYGELAPWAKPIIHLGATSCFVTDNGDLVIYREALRLLEEDRDIENVLGARFVKAYCAVKREEFEAFNKVISSWEREYLLLNV